MGDGAAGSIKEGIRIGRVEGKPIDEVGSVVGEIGIVGRAGDAIGKPIGSSEETSAERVSEEKISGDAGKGKDDVVATAAAVVDLETEAPHVEPGVFGQSAE